MTERRPALVWLLGGLGVLGMASTSGVVAAAVMWVVAHDAHDQP